MNKSKPRRGWNIVPDGSSVQSFNDVLSEQLAESLQLGNQPHNPADIDLTPQIDNNTIIDLQLETDRKIAETLQKEYNLEHDEYIRNAERIINGNQKVRTSMHNYFLEQPNNSSFIQTDNINEEDYYIQYNNLVSSNKDVYRNCKGEIITKHDKDICDRKNADRAMNLPSNLDVGDLIDYSLSHRAYNSLKSMSKYEKRRAHLSKDKSQYSFSQIIMDPQIAYLLMNMLDRGVLKQIGSCIATGKEATILYAEGGIFHNEPLATHCALKVFHTVISDFKTRFKYIKDDFRFRNRMKTLNNRKMINLWTEKEFHNLNMMVRAGIRCPVPVFLRNNVLVMTMIGNEENPAAKLGQVDFSSQQHNIKKAFDETLSIIATLYKDCNLVHADLSEYNLLWHDENVYVLDVAQAVHTDNSDAFEYLYRDCRNIAKFFNNLDMECNADDVFSNVTGFRYHPNDKEYQNKIENYTRTVRTMTAYLDSTKQCDVIPTDAT